MKAIARIETKQVSEAERRITGVATSPRIDRMNDSINPLGVQAAADIPLLMHHDSRLVIGRARLGAPTSRGVPFSAWLPKVAEAGRLRDRVEEAWQSIAHGLLRDVSIGFRAIKAELRDGGTGVYFHAIEVLELSIVSVGANQDATVASTKASKAERAALIQRLSNTRGVATFNRAAHERMVAQEHARDPRLRALRDRRRGRPAVASLVVFGLD